MMLCIRVVKLINVEGAIVVKALVAIRGSTHLEMVLTLGLIVVFSFMITLEIYHVQQVVMLSLLYRTLASSSLLLLLNGLILMYLPRLWRLVEGIIIFELDITLNIMIIVALFAIAIVGLERVWIHQIKPLRSYFGHFNRGKLVGYWLFYFRQWLLLISNGIQFIRTTLQRLMLLVLIRCVHLLIFIIRRLVRVLEPSFLQEVLLGPRLL
jgi:hypothetical protein